MCSERDGLGNIPHGARFDEVRGDDVKRKQQERNNGPNVELHNVGRPDT